VWALVVLCPANFVLLACGSLLVLQALGLADGVKKESGESFVLFAKVSASLFDESSMGRTKRVLVVEEDSRVTRSSSGLGRATSGVQIVG
jgi:hypothetical protein